MPGAQAGWLEEGVTVSSSASAEFRSALQVDKKRIANLTDNELEELMQQLLTAQSHLCGAPLSRALVNTEGKAKDGGADGSSGRPKRPDMWLGDRETCWQFKAGVAGEPSRLLKEVGKPRPSEALRKGKRFVVVASGSNNGVEGVDARLEKLRQAATEAGLPTERITVIGSEGLAAWCNQHPAIAARLENRPDGLSTYAEWTIQAEEMDNPWQVIDSLSSALAEYRQKLDPASQSDAPCLHLHLYGPRGIGKTRLALELCSQSPWVEWLVYVRQASATTVDLLRQVGRDEGVRAVVVVDETPRDLLLPLRDALNLSKGRARLITLGSSHSPDPRRIPELEVTGLPTEGLRALITGWYPAMAAELVSTVVNLAAGNPRLARLAADALAPNPTLTTATLRELPAIRALLEAIAGYNKPLGRSDWSWPKAIDDLPYRSRKREGFVGRDWLRTELQDWARQEQGEQALVIVANYGVGKTAFLAEVIATAAAGRPVVAHHFCRADIRETLKPGAFVRSLASQLAQALPAYRALIEADDAKELRDKLDQATEQSGDSAEKGYDKAVLAFDQAVLATLRRIDPPTEPLLLVVDALDEAQDPFAISGTNGTPPTIVSLLAKHATYLPPWLKVVATSRSREDVLGTLEQAFALKKINAEEKDNLTDLLNYTKQRCQGSPLKNRLAAAQLTATEVAQFLSSKKQSSGKFLYIVLVLNALESEKLPLASRADLEALPPGLDAFYSETFQRRFPSHELYTPIKLLLGLLCVQQEPLGYAELGAILDASIDQIGLWLAPLEDLLRIQSFPSEGLPSSPYAHWQVSFDHVSLQQWLTAYSPGRLPRPRAGRFGVDRAAAAERIRTWALAEVAADRAHTWPYLVRHLASHLGADERPDVIAGLLRQFPWLEARLLLVGINVLLEDFEHAISIDSLTEIRDALQQSRQALSLSCSEGKAPEHFASQMLSRLSSIDPSPEIKALRQCAAILIKNMDKTLPLTSSLCQNRKLLEIIPVDQLRSIAEAGSGLVAMGSRNGRIQIWDIKLGKTIANADCQGRSAGVVECIDHSRIAVAVDHGIQIWDSALIKCEARLEGHSSEITRLQHIGKDRLASSSKDGTVRIWDTATQDNTQIIQNNSRHVALIGQVSTDSIAIADIGQIYIWNHESRKFQFHFQAEGCLVQHVSRVVDSQFLCHVDSEVKIWDAKDLTWSPSILKSVTKIARVSYGRYAVVSFTGLVAFWDYPSGTSSPFVNAGQGVYDLLVLKGNQLATCHTLTGHDSSIRIYNTRISEAEIGEEECHRICAMTIYKGKILTGSTDEIIRVYSPQTQRIDSVFAGHWSYVAMLSAMAGRLWEKESAAVKFLKHASLHGVCLLLSDGQVIYQLVNDDFPQVRNLVSGESKSIFINADEMVTAIAETEKGTVALGTSGAKLYMWNIFQGLRLVNLIGHSQRINSITPVGPNAFATGSSDGTIRLWVLGSSRTESNLSFVSDSPIMALVYFKLSHVLVAGDASGHLHWLQLPESLKT